MGETADQFRIVAKFVKRLQEAFPVTAVFFFGSRARGTYDQWSDFDLIIVSPIFAGLDFFQRWHLVRTSWKENTGADFFCYSPEEYEELKEEISVPGEAVRSGVRVA